VSDSYIIEIDDLAAGILVREGAAFAFHAAASLFFSMQGMIFEGPASAEWAARRLMRGRSMRPTISAGTSQSSDRISS
jgi:hypothetical protein